MGIRTSSLLLILLIVIVLFGTKRLRNIGEDVGAALKSFRKGVEEESFPKKED
jgi:sec-independent protein translocase protein TatA